ncbi:hypothetical protein DPMN_129161 [Dreissena polymorpha]|uniref:Uncharacterized protein n=1 Tax=Dreissena polymorpha TaxID=45954 RepID=A0A9D4H589_DREPO|nr:hypothetical protein DPMN_129161 [Dreissena polymorpha]
MCVGWLGFPGNTLRLQGWRLYQWVRLPIQTQTQLSVVVMRRYVRTVSVSGGSTAVTVRGTVQMVRMSHQTATTTCVSPMSSSVPQGSVS